MESILLHQRNCFGMRRSLGPCKQAALAKEGQPATRVADQQFAVDQFMPVGVIQLEQAIYFCKIWLALLQEPYPGTRQHR